MDFAFRKINYFIPVNGFFNGFDGTFFFLGFGGNDLTTVLTVLGINVLILGVVTVTRLGVVTVTIGFVVVVDFAAVVVFTGREFQYCYYSLYVLS